MPTLQFHYHNPAAPKEKWFPLTTAREVRITVTAPRPKVEAQAIPMGEPEWLLSTRRGRCRCRVRDSRETGSGSLSRSAGPLRHSRGWRRGVKSTRTAFAWRGCGGRVPLDARSKAFDHANRAPDPPAAIGTAVLGYLRARFPLAPAAATPTEIGSALGELGLSGPEVEAVVGFFRDCDAERFASGSDAHGTLAADAAALIGRLEEA